jgi:uncharacterized protein YxjI
VEQTSAVSPAPAGAFTEARYLIRKKVLKLAGGAFHVYKDSGELAFFSEMKAFKLKEDIRIYSDESKQNEVLLIAARQILDFSAAYDVTDAASGMKVGALKRKGARSILRDEWVLMDAGDQEIGLILEDSLGLALLRRFLSNWIPEHYEMRIGETLVATYKQEFNPFVLKIAVDFSPDTRGLLDRRLGIAAAILLSAIEGRQQ